MIKKCCVCKKVKNDGKWESGLLVLAGTRISHAYCPSCFAKTMARIKRNHPAVVNNARLRENEQVMYGT